MEEGRGGATNLLLLAHALVGEGAGGEAKRALNIPIDPGHASIMWDSKIIHKVRDKDGKNTQRSERRKAKGDEDKKKRESSNEYLLVYWGIQVLCSFLSFFGVCVYGGGGYSI